MEAILNFLIKLNTEGFGCFEKAGLPNCSQTPEGLKVLQGCIFMGGADNFYDFRWHYSKEELLPVTVLDIWVTSLLHVEAVY